MSKRVKITRTTVFGWVGAKGCYRYFHHPTSRNSLNVPTVKFRVAKCSTNK